MEQWAPICGFEGLYEISTQGRVRNRHGRIRKLQFINSGYLKVDLSIDGVSSTHTVHRLVAETFVPNPERKPEVNHDDGDRENNFASNLEWSTRVENLEHARLKGHWDKASWRTSTTGVRGVTPHPDGGFMARVTINKVRQYLGYFATVEEAATAIAKRKGK